MISVVQKTSGATTAVDAVAATAVWAGNTTTGNLIVVGITNKAAGNTVVSVTDSQLNTYTRISSASNINRAEIWQAQNITGGTTPTITVTISGVDQISVGAYEIAGASSSALDVTATPATSNTALPQVSFAQTVEAGEILIVAVGNPSSLTYTAAAGYRDFITQASGAAVQAILGMEARYPYPVSSGIAPITQSAGGNWAMVGATFKSTSGSPSIKSIPLRPHTFSPGLAR